MIIALRQITASCKAHWVSVLALILLSRHLTGVALDGAVRSVFSMENFRYFFSAAERLRNHEALYQNSIDGHTYVYSPFLAICLIPLTYLSITVAFKVWTLINIAFAYIAIAFYCAASKIGLRQAPYLVLILLTTFRFWPMDMNFTFGQPNCFLLMILCAVHFFEQRQNSTVSAILIAIAAVLKTWMIGFVLYFLIKRKWKAALLSSSVALAVAGGLFSLLGPTEFKTFLSLNSIYLLQKSGGVAPSQSILGFAMLHFRPNMYVEPLLISKVAYYILACGGVGLVCMVLFYSYRINFSAQKILPFQNRLLIGIVISSLLLCSPLTETYYFVLCLPLIWTLLLPISEAEATGSFTVPAYLRVGTLVVYLLFTRWWPTYTVVPEVFKHGIRSLLVTAEFYWSFGLWMIAVVVLYLSNRTETPEPAQGSVAPTK